MLRLNQLLNKVGYSLLENNLHSLFIIAILVIVPGGLWMAVAAVALIALRKGWFDGLRALITGVTVSVLVSLFSISLSIAVTTTIIAFLPCYCMALILRLTRNWSLVMFVLLLQTLLIVALIHWTRPDFILKQYQAMQLLFRELGDNNVISLLTEHGVSNQLVLAHYLLGIQVAVLALSAVFSLMLARSIQSRLFYPGGYRQEVLTFRANFLGLIPFLLVLLGSYQRHLIAVSCLPIFVVYYVGAGLSLGFALLAKNKRLETWVLLVLSMVILPFFMLPIYAIIGVLDSFFNFRLHLPFGSKKISSKHKG